MRFNAEVYNKEFHPEAETPASPVKAHLNRPDKPEEVDEVEEPAGVEAAGVEDEETDEDEEVTDDGGDDQSASE